MPRGQQTKELWKNPSYKEHMRKVHIGKKQNVGKDNGMYGKVAWNRGKHIKFNNALEVWRKNGGQNWNKGLRGLNSGEKSPNWKGGITPIILQIRHCFEYRQWRSDILTRDNYVCQFCGQRGGELVVDHFPKAFSQIFHDNNIKSLQEALVCEEFWNINNGRTLCNECHKKTDTYLRRSIKKLK